MKKLFMFIIFFLFIVIIHASGYTSSINGEDVMYPYDETRSNYFFVSNMRINIDDIEDLSSFNMYISYDKDKIGVSECSLFDGNKKDCTFSSDNSVIKYSYKYSKDYKFDKDFYIVSFVSNNKTPNNGTSDIKVYFEDAKDKNGNDVKIDESVKTITFKEIGEYYVPSDNKKEESEVSSYIKELKIDGYDIDFDSKTQDYTIKVDNEINKLDISVELYDKNGRYIITGASDLNSFSNKISILVTSSDNEEREYKINVIREKQEINKASITGEVNNIVKKTNIKSYIPFIGGGIVLIILLVLIIKKLSSKKLDKFLDNI